MVIQGSQSSGGFLGTYDYIWVQLDERGEQILREGMPANYKRLPRLNGWTQMQLHDVMRLFGPYVFTGDRTPCGNKFWIGRFPPD